MKKFLSLLLVLLLSVSMTLAIAEEETEETVTLSEDDCICDHATIEVNGTSLYYGVAGEGKPVIVVHGNGGSHTALQTEINALVEAGYKVYAVDSRGQGANEPVAEYHYADMAEDYYAFITELGLEGCAWYGWSDGGNIGLMLNIAHPGAVSIMAISGANLFPEGAVPEILEYIAQILEEIDDPCTAMMLVEPQIDPADLANITIPVLVTAGSEDLILPEHTELIAESLPNSIKVIVDGAGHETYIYGSDVMGQMLVDYLNEYWN